MSEVTFEQEVQAAAKEANLPDVPDMTPEEEAIPAEVATQPEPAQAPVEEPKSEEPAVKEEKAVPETVPLAVHIRQREKHDRELMGLRQQLTQMQQQFAQGNERLQQITSMLHPEEAPPDPKTDVIGTLLYEQQQLRKQMETVSQRMVQADTEARSRNELERFSQFVVQDEKRFEQEAPDYKQAIDWVKGVKLREYQALGMDEHQAVARVQQDALAIATHAAKQGASPAEFGYRLAKALGFQAGQAKATAPAATPKSEADNVIAMRQAGTERSKPAGGAAQGGGALTFADLAAMDNEEFAKMTSGNNWKKLAGGG